MNNLANCYSAAGRIQDALKLRQETFKLMKAKLGRDHPDTLNSMNNLGSTYYELHRTQDALKIFEETLELRLVNAVEEADAAEAAAFELTHQRVIDREQGGLRLDAHAATTLTRS